MKAQRAQVAIVFKRRTALDRLISEIVYFRMTIDLKTTNKYNFLAVEKCQRVRNLIIRSAMNFLEMLEASIQLSHRHK